MKVQIDLFNTAVSNSVPSTFFWRASGFLIIRGGTRSIKILIPLIKMACSIIFNSCSFGRLKVHFIHKHSLEFLWTIKARCTHSKTPILRLHLNAHRQGGLDDFQKYLSSQVFTFDGATLRRWTHSMGRLFLDAIKAFSSTRVSMET